MEYSINGLEFYVYLDENGYYRDCVSDRLVHRIIAEMKFNKPLEYWQVVHHIDGNKLNNDPKNLYICAREFHEIIHDNRIYKEDFWRFVYAVKVDSPRYI